MKSAAGVTGLLAILTIAVGPFLRLGVHYLMLKATAGLCSVFGSKRVSGTVQDFSSAFGLVLGMTGAVVLLFLISTVCFLRGIA